MNLIFKEKIINMNPSVISGYAAKTIGAALEQFTYKPPNLGDSDVRISVTHCGVCHTDIQAIENYYAITSFPFVPGHEIVGYVSEIGSSVTDLNIGDRVGIGGRDVRVVSASGV